MDSRFKFTTIGHQRHGLCSPISLSKLDAVLDAMDLKPTDRVLELCTGKAELLRRLVRRCPGVSAVGVDLNTAFLAEAREMGAPDIELVAGDAWEYLESDAGPWDAVINIGGARRNDVRQETANAMAAAVRPGGVVVLGDGFFRRPPDPEYVKTFGFGDEDCIDLRQAVRFGENAGLRLLYAACTTEEELAHYEGLYWSSLERWMDQNPTDPDVPAFRERLETWRDGHLRFGHDTLSFAVLVYLKPSG